MALQMAVIDHRDPGCTLVEMTGALDATSGPAAQARLRELIAGGRDRLVLDVSGLGFCDSGGIWLLLDVHRRADAAGGWVRLAGVTGFLSRLFSITQLHAAFTIDADVAASLAAVAAERNSPVSDS
ncbi:STAS domain-containing protein [Sphaerisporangium corydalis]|uniref:STAS domain-containing protein n=1 Tax=Sphaerisporangium corydalis TaxID=1441875 RepID=A0ABV9E8A9_9ACTN|nr:STAS domain-containing protein [Sphaerisporangium corydalis]